MGTALLFDREKVDAVADWESLVGRLGKHAILWIDSEKPDERTAAELAESLDLDPETIERLRASNDDPYFRDWGTHLHVTAYAPAGDELTTDLVEIDCLVSERWIVTVHDAPVAVIDEFRDRAGESTGETGRLDGLEFLANFLEWVLNAYLRAFDAIEDALGEFDSRAMEGRLDEPAVELRRLVSLRRRVGDLRRALVSHREMLLSLTRPELEAIASSRHAERFTQLGSRLEDAVQGARDTRDSIVGSFDVLIARTEMRTNEIVKVLTLASVLFLPGALIAGVLGMNFRVGMFESTEYFWVVLVVIVGIAAGTLMAARIRKWI